MRNLVLLLLLCSSYCFAQNKVNEHGQRVGHWRYENPWRIYNKGEPVFIVEGYYKIITINRRDIARTHRSLGDTACDILDMEINARTINIGTYGRHKNTYSVKDGIWKYYDSAGRLYNTMEYIAGILIEEDHYSTAGKLAHSNNKVSGKRIYYINGRPFKQVIGTGWDASEYYQYYPEGILEISKAELSFDINVLLKKTKEHPVYFLAKNKITIDGIKTSKKIDVFNSDHQKITFPIVLQKGDTMSWVLQFRPFISPKWVYDTITVLSSDTTDYKIYCYGRTPSITRENLMNIKQITLSKSGDRFIDISNYDGTTKVNIKNGRDEKEIVINRFENKDIPLADYAPGEYEMKILMEECKVSNTVKLIITD